MLFKIYCALYPCCLCKLLGLCFYAYFVGFMVCTLLNAAFYAFFKSVLLSKCLAAFYALFKSVLLSKCLAFCIKYCHSYALVGLFLNAYT